MSTTNSYLPQVGDILQIDNEYILVISMSRRNTNQHGRIYQRSVWSPFVKGQGSKIIGTEPAVIWDFYFVSCTKTGSLKAVEKRVNRYGAANSANHSNMLIRHEQDAAVKVGFKKLKETTVFHNCRKYVWNDTGIEALDQYMSQVDDRYDLWVDVLKPNRSYWKIELYQFAWNFQYTKRNRARIFNETQNSKYLNDLPLPTSEVA